MNYKIDKNGFYLGVKNENKEDFEYFTTVDIPIDFKQPQFIKGEWIETFIEVIEVPNEVPLWCIKAILNEMGLLEIVEGALTQLEEPLKSRANYIWNYGNIIKRDSLTVAFIGQALQKSDTEIDEIFVNADKIEL